MILDPSRRPVPRPAPPNAEGEGRKIERIAPRQKSRAAPIRSRQKPLPGSLAARAPPIDAAVVDAGVSAYLNQLTQYDAGPIPPDRAS